MIGNDFWWTVGIVLMVMVAAGAFIGLILVTQ